MDGLQLGGKWSVTLTKRVEKQLEKIPDVVVQRVFALVYEIEKFGPLRYNWKNFGKLQGTEDYYHCHIQKGRPTYVVCWKVVDKKIQIVEVYYVGTHEKAPY